MCSYESVYQKLRENILNGHYKHGDELRETAVLNDREMSLLREKMREFQLDFWDELF